MKLEFGFEGCNFSQGVGFLFALHGDYGFRCTAHKALVGQFALDAFEELALVVEFGACGFLIGFEVIDIA